jgi:phosphatidylinositol glycan class B
MTKLQRAVRPSSLVDKPRTGWLILGVALLGGFAARVWLSLTDDGIYWPDEIYQSLEPAHRLVFGYGMIPWEYGLGARTWLLPGIVAALLYSSDLIGWGDPRAYLTVVRVVMSAAAVATAGASYVLARRLGAAQTFAACGAAFFALAGPVVYFGPKALSENVSALPVAGAFACLLGPSAGRREWIVGGSLLGLAIMLRLHNGIFPLALLMIWVAQRRWRAVLETTAVLLVWAVLFGLFDRITWGGWYQSAELYFRFTFGMGGGPVTGASPAFYYPQMFVKSMPVAAVAVLLLALIGATRARTLGVLVAVFFLAHSMTPNKAYRYALPALPLLGALAAVGLQRLAAAGAARATLPAAVLLAGCLWSLAVMPALTFGDIGPYERSRPHDRALDDRGPINRLLITAFEQPDLCGLKLERHHLTWVGGYSYLHRNVPLYSLAGPYRESQLYNYIITGVDQTAGNPVAFDGDYVLRRIGTAPCRPDPDFDWRLPGYDHIRRGLGR